MNSFSNSYDVCIPQTKIGFLKTHKTASRYHFRQCKYCQPPQCGQGWECMQADSVCARVGTGQCMQLDLLVLESADSGGQGWAVHATGFTGS